MKRIPTEATLNADLLGDHFYPSHRKILEYSRGDQSPQDLGAASKHNNTPPVPLPNIRL